MLLWMLITDSYGLNYSFETGPLKWRNLQV